MGKPNSIVALRASAMRLMKLVRLAERTLAATATSFSDEHADEGFAVAEELRELFLADRRDALRRLAPVAVGEAHSMFIDKAGCLLTCGCNEAGEVLGHAASELGSPTPVPSMPDRRIVSVATSDSHCLALTAQGEVYSWGDGDYGALGHGDDEPRIVPSQIESLSRIERIAAGDNGTSAAVDEEGCLFTWGGAFTLGDDDEKLGPNGLGYEVDPEMEGQLTPKRVDALFEECVVGLALGYGFTLVVTDAGAVFSFGYSEEGALGHGALAESEVLPRLIDALAETGRLFVGVAAGGSHALALTEEGELYGWGDRYANGHGREEPTPHRVAALIEERVKLAVAGPRTSCAVTEEGEIFTWGRSAEYSLGHGVLGPQPTAKRVEALSGARIAAVAMAETHTLVADEDGVVWAFGNSRALGLSLDPEAAGPVKTPTTIPALRVRALKLP